MTWFELCYWTLQLLALLSWIALPIGLWKIKSARFKTHFLVGVMLINLALGAFHFWDQRSVPLENQTPLGGDFWDIETVFQADHNVASRAWKRSILEELITNLNAFRTLQKLEAVSLETVESFSPAQLYQLQQVAPEQVQLLDVREAYERSGYALPGAANYRYGDLANNIVPHLDPGKRVVVICYSGIRGYLAANLLAQLGFEQPGFIRGGLEAWHEAGLPAQGDYRNFSFLAQTYDRYNQEAVSAFEGVKIDFRNNAAQSSFAFPQTLIFNGELATSTEVDTFMESLEREPVMLLCETESDCYDARMFAYNYEALGGVIMGYYQF